MKKILFAWGAILLSSSISAQYLIVGNDSISVDTFKKDYEYGLKHNGIAKTIQTTEDFLLLQQFAKSKKADTTMSFTTRLWAKENELRSKHFYPKEVTQPLLRDYVNDNKTERQVQIFILKKEATDKTDYQKIYNEVKAGKMTMKEAISKYTKGNPEPYYIKPGNIDNTMYSEIKTLPNNSYTKLFNTNSIIAFAKVLATRPSLGYMIFGTLSYPNDEKATTLKSKIEAELKSGKKFEEVTKEFGTTEQEKKNGGVVLGSPTLPDEVYQALKGQKEGFTSAPILMDNKYFIFHIYKLTPYQLNEQSEDFLFKDMQNTLFAEILQEKMLQYIKGQKGFKEFPAYQNLKTSYQAYANAKLPENEVLFQFNNIKTTFGDLKKIIDPKKDDAAKLSSQNWASALGGLEDQRVVEAYNEDLINHNPLKEEVEKTKKMLFSDFVFSKYIKDEIEHHPNLLTDYFNTHKADYMLETRAKGRVAIIADPKLVSDIKKEIKNPKQWEFLKARFKGKLNEKSQVLVQFEEGEMSKSADIFTTYEVPFKTGVFTTRIGERDLVIAVDDILQPTPMSYDEAKESVKDALTNELMNKIVSEQKAKTKIVVEPGFISELEKNFKK